MAFDHERLDVYNVALDFLALADEVIQHLPRGQEPRRRLIGNVDGDVDVDGTASI